MGGKFKFDRRFVGVVAEWQIVEFMRNELDA